MAIDTGTSLDTGASDITYTGDEGPRSPEENRRIASAILGDESGDIASEIWSGMSSSERNEWGNIENFINSDDFKTILINLQTRRGLGNMKMASADPILQDEYDQYVFDLQEHNPGVKPMSIEQFREQAISGMASGGIARLGYQGGYTAGGHHEGMPDTTGGGHKGGEEGQRTVHHPGLYRTYTPVDVPRGISRPEQKGIINTSFVKNQLRNAPINIIKGAIGKKLNLHPAVMLGGSLLKNWLGKDRTKETLVPDEYDFSDIEGQEAKLVGLALAQKRVLEKKKGMSDLGGPEFTPTDQKFLDKLIEMDKEEKVYSKPILTAKAEQLSLPGWGIYDKQDPIQKLPVSGETPLFKVNEVELKYLIQEIEQLRKEEEWKNSNSDGNHQNI